jgi:hypothetical protein
VCLAEDVEVHFATERDDLPRLPGILAADQPQASREVRVHLKVRMPRTEERAWTRDGESHRVLMAVGDPLGVAVLGYTEQAEVRGGVEHAVGGIHAEPVHVLHPYIRRGFRRLRPCGSGRAGGQREGRGAAATARVVLRRSKTISRGVR